MKKSLTLLTLAMASLGATAQISLHQSGYTSWTPASDSIRNLGPVSLTSGPNAVWDLTASPYAPQTPLMEYTAGTDINFPDASFHQTMQYPVGASLSYEVQQWRGIGPLGYATYGETIEHQNLDLSQLVGMSVGDSIVFPTQSIVYDNPRWEIKFPATYNNNWMSEYRYSTAFNVWIAAMMLNNTPGERVANVLQVDTVSGWGKMIVNNNAGQPSDSIDVLEIKVHQMFTDSFYIMGMPIDDADLSALGLSQGMVSESFSKRYFRIGEITPLVEIMYSDGSYSSPMTTVVHTDRLPIATSIGDLTYSADISLYPNPVTNGHLNVYLPAVGNWTYQLINTSGQTTLSGSLLSDGTSSKIDLGNMTPGVYFMRLSHENNTPTVHSIVVR